jgi:hypothetical protein
MTRHTTIRRTGAEEAVAVIVDALATYRLTRLLVSDGIADRPRDALLQRLRDRNRNKLVELIECPWCLGFWVAGAVVIARCGAPAVWGPTAKVLAFSAGAGIVASAVRSMDDQHSVAEGLEPELVVSTPLERAAL